MTGRRARRPRERKARAEVPPSVERYILAQRPRHRPLLRLLRKVVRDALPGAGEALVQGQPCYVVGAERVACPYVSGDHVNLGLFRGADVDDRRGVLEGSGKGMRHVAVGVPSDIKRRELTMLLRQAAGLEPPRSIRGDLERGRDRGSGSDPHPVAGGDAAAGMLSWKVSHAHDRTGSVSCEVSIELSRGGRT